MSEKKQPPPTPSASHSNNQKTLPPYQGQRSGSEIVEFGGLVQALPCNPAATSRLMSMSGFSFSGDGSFCTISV